MEQTKRRRTHRRSRASGASRTARSGPGRIDTLLRLGHTLDARTVTRGNVAHSRSWILTPRVSRASEVFDATADVRTARHAARRKYLGHAAWHARAAVEAPRPIIAIRAQPEGAIGALGQLLEAASDPPLARVCARRSATGTFGRHRRQATWTCLDRVREEREIAPCRGEPRHACTLAPHEIEAASRIESS